jgi:hypothetical protein
MKKFFVASYTHQCKDYCDAEFIQRFAEISAGMPTLLIDNSPESSGYHEKLKELVNPFPWVTLQSIEVDPDPKETLFHRNVERSANLIRDHFLQSVCDYLVIIESDVIPPKDLLELFSASIDDFNFWIDRSKWGILGGLYYTGFHDFNKTGIQQTNHVLSGCTVYKRELIERFPFRYDPSYLVPFPDAWMSHDARNAGYTLWDDHSIICKHLEAAQPGRKSRPL